MNKEETHGEENIDSYEDQFCRVERHLVGREE